MTEVSEATCEAKHDAVERDIKDIKLELLRLWDKVDRLPAWAVWSMTFLGSVAGGAVGWMLRGLFV